VLVSGTFERHTSLRWGELQPSAAGGRWGARRAYEVLYLGRPRDSIVVEAYRHLVDDELDEPEALAAAVIERRVITCQVAVPRVLDMRPPAAQRRLVWAPTDCSRTSAITLPARESAPRRTSLVSRASSPRLPQVSARRWRYSQ
jgi:hypothetical protein